MKYFLAKTEPDTYSILNLQMEGWANWNGVRNPQAVAYIKEMEIGDKVFIYHSGMNAAIAGISEVVKAPEPDPDDRKSWTVGLKHLETFKTPITLKEIKATGKFDDFRLIYQSRLSTMDVPDDFIDWLKKEKRINC